MTNRCCARLCLYHCSAKHGNDQNQIRIQCNGEIKMMFYLSLDHYSDCYLLVAFGLRRERMICENSIRTSCSKPSVPRETSTSTPILLSATANCNREGCLQESRDYLYIGNDHILQGPSANYIHLLCLYPPSKSQPSQNIYTPLLVSTSDH